METEIEFLKRIVKEANKISEKHFEVFSKGGEDDLVTSLDMEIEKYLISEIKANYPTFDIVSEEFNENSEVTDNCFIMDPIDGTINFALNIPLWGIQIACRKNGETIASVISVPKLNEFYYADTTGAYLNDERIFIKEVPISNAAYSIYGNNHVPAETRMRKYSSHCRFLASTSVSMAFMACGRLHGVVYRRDKAWDFEPGLFMCKMAGAVTKSISGFHAAAMNQEYLELLEKETAKNMSAPNIYILHSLNGDTIDIWGKDVRDDFRDKDIEVITPGFPKRENSSYGKFDEVLSFYLNNKQLNNNSIIIAHSIANPYFIRFCREHNYQPKAYIAVAPRSIYEYPIKRNDYIVDVMKQAYLNQEDLDFIKNMNSVKYCLYSDEDENNEEFTRFIYDTNSNGMYLENYNHFDEKHRIYRIPELNDLINKLL